MISFNALGRYGRFGNQLFQYAYLRSQAKRLGTTFHCPAWLGETVFDLSDAGEKTGPFEATSKYIEPDYEHGYNPEAANIKDGTDVAGYFQTEKYFKEFKNDVLRWFAFSEGQFAGIRAKYAHIDLKESTAIHIRLGDYASPQLTFYTPRRFYFRKALELVRHKKHILVFSDDPALARIYFKGMKGDFTFIEGNQDPEDFYLMSSCRDIICSPSSFSWWAAYLNRFEDKTIIVPSSWFLPGSRSRNDDIFVSGWTKLRAHRIFFDQYKVRFIPHLIGKYLRRMKKGLHILKTGGWKALRLEARKAFEKKD